MKRFALAKAVALVALGIALEAAFLLEIGTPPAAPSARAAAVQAAGTPPASGDAALARCRAAHPGDPAPRC